ncbi:MAG: ParB/RepB/Spo0J family partition protein [Bacteroidales bacterium]|nr:ParB/RepB/Spo0J family partition protein [Bacteroidales bacterium]MDD3431216.1 ParB/RepB/Spo0J family partition protein [Bacteroidales bacterium]MDD4362013.1 ParB/RepB/Spo0J family partition protein [Bacteroidales bacterium]MDD4430668.1 ParB/RepB/Spo0J family partition protein [Bacteroidales bacterium]
MAIKNKLGRGLDALISTDDIQTVGSSSISEVELELIRPNPEQPRTDFEPDALEELAVSIREIGIIQPVTLRKMDEGYYQIISGERRVRASKSIGLKKIPAYIKTAEDDLMMEMALIENIQREDLNAIEIALAYQKLAEVYKLTQEKLSERIGKKRTTISNYMRLLKLPAEIQMGLKNKTIDMGHARALINVKSPGMQLALYEQILKQGLSVRKVEELVRDEESGKSQNFKKTLPRKTSEEYKDLQKQLSLKLGTKVRFSINEQGKGNISIPFATEKKLEEILLSLDKLFS